MTLDALPQCFRCVHFDEAGWRCPAFPGDAIPEPIRANAFDHRREWSDGDGGIRFEAKPGERSPFDEGEANA